MLTATGVNPTIDIEPIPLNLDHHHPRVYMPLIDCPECTQNVSTAAAACPHCGHPMTSAALSAAPQATHSTAKARNNKPLSWLVLVLLLVVVVLGNVHVVSGAPNGGIFVKKVSFGFEDTFASVSDCTTSPWIVASSQHGKLCRALADANVIESDAALKARAQGEFEAQYDKALRDAQEQQRRLARELQEQINAASR